MDYKQAITKLFPFINEAYQEYLAQSQRNLQNFLDKFPSEKISCQKGCGACCHFPIVPCTAGEAFVLLNKLLVEGFALDTLAQRLFEYTVRYFEFAKKHGTLPITNESQKEFLSTMTPCPFLTKKSATSFEGICGIFEHRPLICDFFNNLDSPKLCMSKSPHRSLEAMNEVGSVAQDKIREQERRLFGRSTIGHLPLLLAALCTDDGLKAFLSEKHLTNDELSEEYAQELNDFSLLHELLGSIGYHLNENDLHALATAQAEAGCK